MPRPVPRRRGREDEAPDADKYTGRRGRTTEDAPDEDRRPRRGRERGELPASRGRRSEPEPPEDTRPRRSRRSEPDEPTEPTTIEELDKLNDDEREELLTKYDIPTMDDSNDEDDALLEAILQAQEPPPSEGRGRGRGRSRESEPADEAPHGGRRGRSRDDEPDDRPARTPRAGFQGYKKAREKTFTGDFKLTEDELLVKFLDDEPFDSYVEHGLFKELNDGQRVWICIEENCPICATGHTGRAVGLWNIIAIPEEGDPTVEVLKAGPGLTKELEKKAALKTGPLTKEYYSLSQPLTKRGEQPQGPNVEVIRERDVKEDWGFDPFTDAEIEDFREMTPDPTTYVQFPSLSDLKDVAKRLRDRD